MSYNAVLRVVRRHGHQVRQHGGQPSKLTAEDCETVRRMYQEEGLLIAVIAERTGLGEDPIRRR